MELDLGPELLAQLFKENNRVYVEWKNLTSLWIGSYDQLGAWPLMACLADRYIPTIRTFNKNIHWDNHCDCGIITIDMVRRMTACMRGGDILIFGELETTPFACTRHSIMSLPMTYDHGSPVLNPATFNPPSFNHIEYQQ